MVRERLTPIDFEGDVDSIIELLVNLKKIYSEKGRLYIDKDYPDRWSDTYYYYLFVEREETEKEKKEKVAKDKQYKKEQETKDRATYERLKKKFG